MPTGIMAKAKSCAEAKAKANAGAEARAKAKATGIAYQSRGIPHRRESPHRRIYI